MNIILLGPPGSGKGTLAENLKKKIKVIHISTGEILREATKNGTDLGKKANQYIEKGLLVPDELMIDIIKEKTSLSKKGFIFDGFPRTINQAEALERIIKINVVINLEVSDKTIIERLSGRRICKNCQSIYHLETLKPKNDGKCDKCLGELYLRHDDKPETVSKRLQIYKSQTKPLIDYYKKKGLLKILNAELSIDKVFEQAIKVVQ